MVLAGAVALAVTLQFMLSFQVVAVLKAFDRGEAVSTVPVTAYDTFSFLVVALELAAGVVTIVWLWRSRAFAEAVAPQWPHARSRVWVWLGWIVPVVAYWFPYQVVRDIRAAVRGDRSSLALWWSAWLVFGFASQISGRVLSSDSLDVWSTLPLFDGLAAVSVVVAALGWARVVREVSAGQRAMVTPASAPAPALP
ncbi:DUF4328 domain-containing protein [Oerskovia turbata]